MIHGRPDQHASEQAAPNHHLQLCAGHCALDSVLNTGHCVLITGHCAEHWAFCAEHWALRAEHWTLRADHWTLCPEHHPCVPNIGHLSLIHI